MERNEYKAINSEKYGPVVLCQKESDKARGFWSVFAYCASLKEAQDQAKQYNKLEKGLFTNPQNPTDMFKKAVNI
jgi:hypothetical protein